MKRITRSLAMPTLLAASLTLAACGTGGTDAGHDMSVMTPGSSAAGTASSPAGSAAAAEHNDADVAFATGMIPHHGQAITMADMALKQATSTQVKDLATAIKGAQDPEIQIMSGWLKGWGQTVPDSMGMHHGGEGMMSMDEMTQLETATGAGFDRMWVQMMIKHHEGAVAMARTELSQGSNGQAKQLAQAIIDAQSTEIATMRALLKSGLK